VLVADTDPPIPSIFWRTRQFFLNLCQGNHYQFDQVRRAKHSTMMVVYHMHRPFAPSFVHSCNYCSDPIKLGRRFSCLTCEDFDLCERCYKLAEEGATPSRPEHEHALQPFAAVGAGDDTAQQAAQEKQQEQLNARNHYLRILMHASYCAGSAANCTHDSCRKMRALLVHQRECALPGGGGPGARRGHASPLALAGASSPAAGGGDGGGDGAGAGAATPRGSAGCAHCRRLRELEEQHARECRLQSHVCQVPYCAEFKARLRSATGFGSGLDVRRRAKANALAVGKRPAGDNDDKPEKDGGAEGGPGGAGGARAGAGAGAEAAGRGGSEAAGGAPQPPEHASDAPSSQRDSDVASRLLHEEARIEARLASVRAGPDAAAFEPVYADALVEHSAELRKRRGLPPGAELGELSHGEALHVKYTALQRFLAASAQRKRVVGEGGLA